MLGRIVKFNRSVEMNLRIPELTRVQQRCAHQAVPRHEWPRCTLPLGAVEELRASASIASPLKAT